MLAGPSALLIALCLLPGWVYWRWEGSARNARSPLHETFEVVAASAVAVSLAGLAYLGVQPHTAGFLTSPVDLNEDYLRTNALTVARSLALLVAAACVLAATAAARQRRRRRVNDDYGKYHGDSPMWVSALGLRHSVNVTVDVRTGDRYTGLLGAYDITAEATPPVLLLAPVGVERSSRRRLSGWVVRQPDTFSKNNVVIPGTEVLAIWVDNVEE